MWERRQFKMGALALVIMSTFQLAGEKKNKVEKEAKSIY